VGALKTTRTPRTDEFRLTCLSVRTWLDNAPFGAPLSLFVWRMILVRKPDATLRDHALGEHLFLGLAGKARMHRIARMLFHIDIAWTGSVRLPFPGRSAVRSAAKCRTADPGSSDARSLRRPRISGAAFDAAPRPGNVTRVTRDGPPFEIVDRMAGP
jgi:hypothetical protein